MIWDTETGEHKQTLNGHTIEVSSAAFSPDGKTLASGSRDKTIRIWNAKTGEHKHTLNGHIDVVNSIAFSPDGKTIASGSSDGTILLWEFTPPALSDATVSLSPPVLQSPAIGDQLTFDLNVVDGDNVSGYQATVTFDDTALHYVSSENGDFLPAGAAFAKPVVEDNRITISASAPDGETNGDGTLATVTFEIVSIKPSTLKLSKVSLLNADGQQFLPQFESTDLIIEDAQAVEPNGKHYTKWGKLKTTTVFQNYPNPFNPETWIPYQLATTLVVGISIYTADGELVRRIDLGLQSAGVYVLRNRAAYWDGKNKNGEPVASGVYYYTFTAGDFSTTRKMLILK